MVLGINPNKNTIRVGAVADSGKATILGTTYSELGAEPISIVGTFLDSYQPYPSRTGYEQLRWIALCD